MNKQVKWVFLILSLMTGLFTLSASAQNNRAPVTSPISTPATSKALTMLPASDAVMYVEVKRLLTEVLPRVFAGNPAKLAQANAEVEKFRTTTGVDPRLFERVAISAKFVKPSPDVTKVQTVMVAQGTFSAPTIVAAGRLAAKGKYQEEKYQDKTIYIFSLNEQIKVLGLLRMNVGDLALAVLDNNTLAIGSPATVRECLDANKSGAKAFHGNDPLLALATRTPNAVIGFGGNLPVSLTQNFHVGNEEISRNIASIRQFYGSIGSTTNGFDFLTVLKTEDASGAQGLSETLSALKQLAPLLSSQLPAPRAKIAQTLVDALQITKEGTEVQLKLAVAPADFPTLMGE